MTDSADYARLPDRAVSGLADLDDYPHEVEPCPECGDVHGWEDPRDCPAFVDCIDDICVGQGHCMHNGSGLG